MSTGWLARLELGFEQDGPRSVLRHRRHEGPLRVQRSFHPEGNTCHSYLIHPPGGVVGGDRLEVKVNVSEDARALITTPAAGKFYRSAGAWARQTQHLRVAAGASLEWLPALNILHGGARVHMRNRFDLAPDARLLAWDLVGLGRPGSGDDFATGALDTRLQVWKENRPLLDERLRLEGGSPALTSPWGLRGQGYMATLLAWPATPGMLEGLRAAMNESPEPRPGCTLLSADAGTGSASGLLVCRWLAPTGEALWNALVASWSLLRPQILGRPACPPRIWST
ncbi:MAG: urease accessory protein UreD [Xanthomonadales bacterium]|nr:urease accessory protein UreD [Xanthomonadales bacterium]